MKKQIIMTISGLLVSAALVAQLPQQDQTRTQSGTRTQTRVRTQGPDQTQGEYKNHGQMIKAQKHARNAERKALKRQQKELKKQGIVQQRMQYREQDRQATRNGGTARPATQQRNATRMQRGTGGGRR